MKPCSVFCGEPVHISARPKSRPGLILFHCLEPEIVPANPKPDPFSLIYKKIKIVALHIEADISEAEMRT